MTTNKKTKTTKILTWIWGIFLIGFGFIFLLFFLTSLGLFGKLPTFEELENPQNDLASQVISEDGKTIGKYFKENRTPIKFKELPVNLVNALIATEDVRYFEHAGIDIRGTLRAVAFAGKKGGASTITQQLAKLLFHERPGNLPERLIQKVQEWIIAVRLEKQYTKEEIIAMYLNKMDFLNHAIGIRSASRIYFGKEAKDLDQIESAVIVAMLKNPRQFNPKRKISKKKAFKRRNTVLNQMEKYGFLTEKIRDSLKKQPTVLNYSPEDTNDGMATYFREYLRKYLLKWVKDNPKADGETYNIYRDGLKVHVSIDSRMQKHAEDAMKQHMANLQNEFDKYQQTRYKKIKKKKVFNNKIPFDNDLTTDDIDKIMKRAMKNSKRWRRMKKNNVSEKDIKDSFFKKTDMKVFSWKGEIDTLMTPYDSIRYYKAFLKTGILSIEPQTGHVKAWVGGINHKHFKWDAVKQQERQVGSTFKPFVYATAINQLKYSPCKKIEDTPFIMPKGRFGIPKDWIVHNSGDKYGDPRTMKNALANSINVISARLIDRVSPSNVVKLARSMGIKSKGLEANPSIALGAVELSLYEMVGALSTFVNKGMHITPIMILRIEDKNGTVLESFTPKSNEVMSAESAYTILNLMEGVTKAGTGMRLRTSGKYPKTITGHPYKFTNPIAGKTGTSQNQSDGWFMGMVPNLATGVWVGADDRSIHFPDVTRGQGASMALPIWALYYKNLYADKSLKVSDKGFSKPVNLTVELDCDKEDEKATAKGTTTKSKEEEEDFDDGF